MEYYLIMGSKLTFTAVGIVQGYNRHSKGKYDLQQKGMMMSEIKYDYNNTESDVIPAKTTYQDVPIYSRLIQTKSPFNLWYS